MVAASAWNARDSIGLALTKHLQPDLHPDMVSICKALFLAGMTPMCSLLVEAHIHTQREMRDPLKPLSHSRT